ncbi:hypothetical protein POPTR_001G076050v4 [Populus trichocarpa]|uniref:Uncharacterized protein n=1 Tax=Populus trichocarpa TaxID=3694 RepID=A0ACC0TIQ5_POPTR|nr:hypothetical protein POPTR_001G076050v4 [Populus trichocarpa]
MTSSDGNGALCFRMAVKFMQDGATMPVILQMSHIISMETKEDMGWKPWNKWNPKPLTFSVDVTSWIIQ